MDYPSIPPFGIAYSSVFLGSLNVRAGFSDDELARMRERLLEYPALVDPKYPEAVYVFDDAAKRDEVAGYEEIGAIGLNGVLFRRTFVEVDILMGGRTASMLIEFCRWCLVSIPCQMRGAGGVIHSIADLTKPEEPPAKSKAPKRQRR